MWLAFQRRMMIINSYKDLEGWQVSLDLVDACFDVVEVLPLTTVVLFPISCLPQDFNAFQHRRGKPPADASLLQSPVQFAWL